MSFCSLQLSLTTGPRSQEVWVYADISVDDSYTPQKLSIRAGTYHGDLHEVRLVDMADPKGWQVIKLASGGDRGRSGKDAPKEESVLSCPSCYRASLPS